MVVVNAANIEKDWDHIVAQKGGANVRLRNISDEVALLAVEGPKAEGLVGSLTAGGVGMIPHYPLTEGKGAGGEGVFSPPPDTRGKGAPRYTPARAPRTAGRA